MHASSPPLRGPGAKRRVSAVATDGASRVGAEILSQCVGAYVWCRTASLIGRRAMNTLTGRRAWCVVLCAWAAVTAPSAQDRPDISGIWLIDGPRSGPQPELWLQQRARRFTIIQTVEAVTIDTGDGSLFAVRDPVTETPLVYRLDGRVTTTLDRSLGDLPDFVRKIDTSAQWEDATLVTLTTHLVETPGSRTGITRVVTFELSTDRRTLTVERTAYRGRPEPQRFVDTLPKMLHKGRLEDDRAYAKDRAFYVRALR